MCVLALTVLLMPGKGPALSRVQQMFADCLASILGKKPGFFLILSVSPLLPAMFTVTWTLYRDPSYPYDQRCILPGAHILF